MRKQKLKRGNREKAMAKSFVKFATTNNLTTTEIARGAKVSYHTINRWLKEEQSMRIDTWEKILDFIEGYAKG